MLPGLADYFKKGHNDVIIIIVVVDFNNTITITAILWERLGITSTEWERCRAQQANTETLPMKMPCTSSVSSAADSQERGWY